jgi:hypothetical protein
MVGRTRTALGTEKLTVVTDAGYDSARDIVESMGRGAVPHVAGTDFDVCVPVKGAEAGSEVIVSHKDGRCVYLAERNLVVCPMGKTLYPSFYKKSTKQGVYCNREACTGCGCKCTKEGIRRHQVPVGKRIFQKYIMNRSVGQTGSSVLTRAEG